MTTTTAISTSKTLSLFQQNSLLQSSLLNVRARAVSQPVYYYNVFSTYSQVWPRMYESPG